MLVDENVLRNLIQFFVEINDQSSAEAITEIYERHYGQSQSKRQFDSSDAIAEKVLVGSNVSECEIFPIPFFGRTLSEI